jgi:hypothetical protein
MEKGHFQGSIITRAFSERATARTGTGSYLPRQWHQAPGAGRVFRPVRGVAEKFSQPDDLQARDLYSGSRAQRQGL